MLSLSFFFFFFFLLLFLFFFTVIVIAFCSQFFIVECMTRQVQEIILPVDTTYNLTSPGYPVRNYPGNIICIWKFRVPDGFRVLVNFLDFSLNRYDFLYVASRPLTGNDPPRNLTSSSGTVIAFLSDFSDGDKGFSITASAINVTDLTGM